MPLAIPAAAGRTLYDLAEKRGSSLPFLVFCLLLLDSPVLFAPAIWPALLVIDLVVIAGYLGVRWLFARRSRLTALCENGIVGTLRGQITFTPWSTVVSLSAYDYRGHRGFDVNAEDNVHYRLSPALVGAANVNALVAIIVERAKLVWMGDNLAAREEALQKMANVLVRD